MTAEIADPPDRLLRLPQVLPVFGQKKTALYSAINRGFFPKPVKLGRSSLWPESELRSWLEARKAERPALA